MQSGTSGHIDTYGFTNIAGTPATVIGVNVGSVARTANGGQTDLQHQVLSNGTSASSATMSDLTPSNKFRQKFFGQDPNTTAAWTASGINAAEFGIKKP